MLKCFTVTKSFAAVAVQDGASHNGTGLPDGQSLRASRKGTFSGRKVRSPQGSMPANGRGGSLKAGFTESATEKIPPGVQVSAWAQGKGEKVR